MLHRLMNRLKFWGLQKSPDEVIDSNTLLNELEAHNKKLLGELEALGEIKEIMKKRNEKEE